MQRTLILICALLASALARGQEAVWPAADQALIHSARLWEVRSRGDLAQLALRKLIAARPNSPQALVELGELDLRVGELPGAAQVLTAMQQRFRDSTTTRDFAIEYRLASRDRLQLAMLRRLLETHQSAQALALLRQLFPNGAPDNALGVEYYHLLARTPNGWPPAYQGLKRLAAQHPDDANYRLALARHLLAGRGHEIEALMLLYQLAQRDDLRVSDVDQLLAEGFRDVPPPRIPAQVLRDYLLRHPNDPRVVAVLAQQRRFVQQRLLLQHDTLSGIEPLLQRELVQAMLARLATRGSAQSDAAAQRAAVLLGWSRPDLDPDDPDLQAALWLNRSRESAAAQRTRLAAAQLQVALAFHDRAFEAVIASAREIEALGDSQASGDLLASAARLDPRSTWLLETRVRWLIAHGRADEALAQLQQHPPGALDGALRSSALDQRASDRRAAAEIDGAIADLEAAVALSPRDPWIRYRLAGLYREQHASERGVALMRAGVDAAGDDPQMRYAQALFLSSLGDDMAAYAAIDAVSAPERSANMINLHDRLQVARERAHARELHDANDTEGARQTLLALEPLASMSLDRARDLAYAWIEIGEPQHGMALLQPWLHGPDGERAQAVLAQMQRTLDLRQVQDLERDGQLEQAQQKLDALLAADPQDRALRVARAELDLIADRPQAARDRLASLVAEQPEDFDTHLTYVRALTQSGDLALARMQLQWLEQHLPPDDADLQLGLARRQLTLGDALAALSTLRPLLAREPARSDLLLLAARAELSLRHFAIARGDFEQAELAAQGQDSLSAQRGAAQIDARLQSSVATAVQVLHQPGVTGVSQLDVATIPTSWILAHGYEQRFTAHADAVTLATGHLDDDYNRAALLGTVQAAGPSAQRRYSNDQQSGVALASGFQTDTLAADLGTTPLGFTLPNIVGGVEFSPTWHSLDATLGIARRALTSSALSYAGLRDPITGEKWGAVVANGPYAGLALYRERFSVSGSVRWSELTGTRVPNNQLLGARASISYQFYSDAEVAAAYTGLVLNYWDYQRNLSNYTFGNAGYYSPHSYLSAALPLELTGIKSGWSYQLRASIAYSISTIAQANFYPNDPSLQSAAVRSQLPSGFDAPVFDSSHGGSLSVSAYAALERQIARGLVLGAMLDLDRTDYYHPTVISLYLRHTFGAFATPLASPPRPTRPYNP